MLTPQLRTPYKAKPIPWIRIEDLPLWESNELLSRAAGAPSQVLLGAGRSFGVVFIGTFQHCLEPGASATPYTRTQQLWPCAVHPATCTTEGVRSVSVEPSSCISSKTVIELVRIVGKGVRPQHAECQPQVQGSEVGYGRAARDRMEEYRPHSGLVPCVPWV